MSFPQPVAEDKVRGKPEKFAEHYAQATLFWNSQTDVEKQHIIRAYRFELTKVQTAAVRRRVVAQLRNVDETLARAVADGLGFDALPDALPLLVKPPARPEVRSSEALSLFARPGKTGIATRRIALLVADGVDASEVSAVQQQLMAQGAVPRVVGVKLGAVRTSAGPALEIEVSMETAPSVLWDALIVFGSAIKTHPLVDSGHAKEFLKDQYRHCKPILLLGSAQSLLAAAGVPAELPSKKPDPALLVSANMKVDRDLKAFIAAVAKHRHFERETDPPRV
jgi:catalase